MRKYQVGFTIIELMVTLVVLAIVAAIAVPSFTTQIRNNHALALAEELVSAINFARSEAIKRGGRISICASNDGANCAGNWNDGWIVFVDSAVADNAAAPVIAVAPAEGVLRQWSDINSESDISFSNNKTFFRYTGLGVLARIDNNPIEIVVRVNGCNTAREITIGISGTLNVARIDCEDEQ